MPEDKVVERRRQTQHKLDIMGRYWKAWAAILANSKGMPFCNAHVWLVDALAGSGLHLSEGDPDGRTAGTPLQAARAAEVTQRDHPATRVHVRAIEIDTALAVELDNQTLGFRQRGVDVEIYPRDCRDVVPIIQRQIAVADHPNTGHDLGRGHQHRSLWLFDPFGIEPIEHKMIASLAYGAEVIVNLDLASMVRHHGKAVLGDQAMVDLLDRTFPGWARAFGEAPAADVKGHVAAAYAKSFPNFVIGEAYPLWATGNQDRFLIQLANSAAAVKAFAPIYRRSKWIGTAAGGEALSDQHLGVIVKELADVFRGETLTTREMRQVYPRYGLSQLRVICQAAEDRYYGKWAPTVSRMEWFAERGTPPTLWG